MAESETKNSHPLAVDMEYIPSWEKWKELWAAATAAEIKHSLLHFGWATGGGVEKVCLYLDLADGYLDKDNFRLPEEVARGWQYNKRDFGTPLGRFEYAYQLRQAVSTKAFQVLCQKFFKNTDVEARRDEPSWLCWVKEDAVLEKVLWFLRTESAIGDFKLRNLPRRLRDSDNHQKVLREFALGISMFALGIPRLSISGRDVCWNNAILEGKLLHDKHSEVVELLNGLGCLGVLLGECKYPLSEEGLAKLKEIALREQWIRLPGYEKRSPCSIEEASYAGSEAAQVYLILQTNNKEKRRLEELVRQMNLAEAARRKVKQLSV